MISFNQSIDYEKENHQSRVSCLEEEEKMSYRFLVFLSRSASYFARQ